MEHKMNIENMQMNTIPPMPVPTSFNVSQVTLNPTGEIMAQLVVTTPTGQFIVFLDPQAAKAVGEALVKVADMSATGLLMP